MSTLTPEGAIQEAINGLVTGTEARIASAGWIKREMQAWLDAGNTQLGSGLTARGQIRNRALSGTPTPSFSLSLLSSLIPELFAGSGTPTFTRATAAAHTDFEGIVRQVPAGAARFQGARYVQNITLASEALNTWTAQNTASVTTGITAPDGTATAFQVDLPTANDVSGTSSRIFAAPTSTTVVNPSTGRVSTWLKADGAGTITLAEIGGGSYDVTVSVTTGWQRLSPAVVTLLGNGRFGVRRKAADLAKVYVWHPQLENVTGQANQNPSEYVPALATANADSGAIGVRYFSTLNGNTVASNVVTEAQGAAITSAAAECAGGVTAGVVDATGPLGFLAEGVRTNLLLWSRDMTNAAWTLGVTMTRALTSTGMDGTANSATRLTAGAVAATNIITQTITAAASSRTYGVYIKRITGAGPVRITQDNFATNTDISGSLVAGVWKLVQLTQSQLNAVMGIKIDTNLDAVDVDMNMFEAATFTSSPIITTTVAVQRNADVLTYPSAGNISGTQGSAYIELAVPNGLGGTAALDVDSAGNRPLWLGSGFGIFDGTTSSTGPNIAASPLVQKGAAYWGGGTMNTFRGGNAGTVAAFDGDMNVGTSFTIGMRGSGGGSVAMFGTVRNLRLYPTALPASRLQGMTT